VSRTKRAPVIDSITALTGPPWSSVDSPGEALQRLAVWRADQPVAVIALYVE